MRIKQGIFNNFSQTYWNFEKSNVSLRQKLQSATNPKSRSFDYAQDDTGGNAQDDTLNRNSWFPVSSFRFLASFKALRQAL